MSFQARIQTRNLCITLYFKCVNIVIFTCNYVTFVGVNILTFVLIETGFIVT